MIEEQEGTDQALESAMQGLDPIKKEAQKAALYVINHHLEKILTVDPPCDIDCGFHWLSIAQKALMVADEINYTRSTISRKDRAPVHKVDLNLAIVNGKTISKCSNLEGGSYDDSNV